MNTRTQIQVRGVVQGVGFRPFVFAQAAQHALKGRVLNHSIGVLIDVEGESEAIERLIQAIASHPPPLSRVQSIERREDLPAARFTDFRIVRSVVDGQKALPVSPDAAVCETCLQEMFDPRNRRYRYPFINCTRCGPRFTIMEEMPYDRGATTMRDFSMCAECSAEYLHEPDRRFHAEPTACPHCGPQLRMTDSNGEQFSSEAALVRALELLTAGKILALKGIGGFHFACDALCSEAVERLRRRKHREEKPFALMAGSVEIIRRFCLISAAEEALLSSPARPIVLLQRKPDTSVPSALATGVRTLGFMLPYAPLHHLLFERLERPLVMTSGNVSDEPIAYRDAEAVERLRDIADAFLLHDRRIHVHAADSVARVHEGKIFILRRSRGYAPAPFKTAFRFKREILACGAQLKNTFCLCKENLAFLSHHIGDLENFATLTSYTENIEHYQRLLDIHPTVIAHDLHPDYLSTRYALETTHATQVAVQHHHAHIAACVAEHGLEGPVIGVAFDGTGFGHDGAIWGGEFFVADLARCHRRAHFRYVPLPGGESAIRQPWRIALSYLQDSLTSGPATLQLAGWEMMDGKKIRLVQTMIRQGLNTVRTSSCGRLFDAVSSILGLRHEVSYEGQAAIELENIAFEGVEESYPFEIDERLVCEIDLRPVIRAIVGEARERRPAGWISAKFHNTIVAVILELCRRMRRVDGLNRVCLGGGVFQNRLLLSRAVGGLRRAGFEVFHPMEVPINDGGIAFGQAAVANEICRGD